MRKLLTVIVPTIPERESMLSRLLFTLGDHLDMQAEVIVIPGTAGLGAKMNAGIAAATGQFMTSVDDDDLVASDFTTAICDQIRDDPDLKFVGFNVAYLYDGRFSDTFIQRYDCPDIGRAPGYWGNDRGPGPKTVYGSELARSLPPFDDSYTGDREWAKHLDAALREQTGTFAHIDRHLYFYDHRPGVSAFNGGDSGLDVGTWPFKLQQFLWHDEVNK